MKAYGDTGGWDKGRKNDLYPARGDRGSRTKSRADQSIKTAERHQARQVARRQAEDA